MGIGMAVSILFVCLGNICRSPLAEVAMRVEADRRGLELHIDSAGTGHWHVGEPPDPRARRAAEANGADASDLVARQVRTEDFETFDLVVALDRQVLAELRMLRPEGSRAEISLLLDHVRGEEGRDVEDPYYGGEDGFAATWRDVTAGAKALADRFAG